LEQARKPLRKSIKTLIKEEYVFPRAELKISTSDPKDNKFFECAYEADVFYFHNLNFLTSKIYLENPQW
jgi:predicted nucleic acid-binding protein